MNNNKKLLFLLATFTLLLVSVSAITAATADDSIIDDTSVSDDIIASDIESTQTTHEVVADNNNNKINTEKNKNLKSPGNTVVVTQDNVENVFGGENHTLNDSISQGDTLDFQGTIWIGEYDSTASAVIGHSLVINKPINVISSTADAIISLNTKAGSLLGEDPGASFVVNHGGSYSNISGLYLNNTECWIHYTDGVHFKNMTMHVENARVGSGVGQTAIRYTDNFLMEGCTIYTENNGGSSSFVVTAGNNITIKDTSIEGVGNVGNLVYLGNPFNTGDVPKDENGAALYNVSASNYGIQVINCTITCQGAAISIPIQNMGKNGTVANNTIYAKTGAISAGTNGTLYGTNYIMPVE